MHSADQHDCKLEHEDDKVILKIIDSGIFIHFRRRFKKYLMVSREHPLTFRYLNSNKQVRKEEKRQLVRYEHMIHPFSMFSLHWSFIMLSVFWVEFVIIPFHMGFPLTETGNTRWILLICQTFHLVHIILCFFFGYHKKEKNVIILDPGKVCKLYVMTYFVPEIASCVPVICTDVRLYRTHIAYKALSFLLYLKLIRIRTFLDYLEVAKYYFNLQSTAVTMFTLSTGFICILLWTNALLCHSRLNRWTPSHLDYFKELETITAVMLRADVKTKKFFLFTILTASLGFLFQLLLYIWTQFVYNKFNSAYSRHNSFYMELDAFMRYKALPVRTRDRIRDFFDFKFPGYFYKQTSLENLTSELLKAEVHSYTAQTLLEQVDIFKDLPKRVLKRLRNCLVSHVYLPGDIIARAGVQDTEMYFLLVGTVGVITPRGKHICFLKDGAYFGQTSMILQISRIATVLAVAPCEILRLHHSRFCNAFRGYGGALERLKEVVAQRMFTQQQIRSTRSESMQIAEVYKKATGIEIDAKEDGVLIKKLQTDSEAELIQPMSDMNSTQQFLHLDQSIQMDELSELYLK